MLFILLGELRESIHCIFLCVEIVTCPLGLPDLNNQLFNTGNAYSVYSTMHVQKNLPVCATCMLRGPQQKFAEAQ